MKIFLGLLAYCIVVWIIAYLIIRRAPVKEEVKEGAAVEHNEFNMYEREEFDL